MRTCDRVLGDGKCGFDASTSGFAGEGEVAAGSDGGSLRTAGLGGFAEGWFEHGVADLAERGKRRDDGDGEGRPKGRRRPAAAGALADARTAG